jgi:hypothetical protein
VASAALIEATLPQRLLYRRELGCRACALGQPQCLPIERIGLAAHLRSKVLVDDPLDRLRFGIGFVEGTVAAGETLVLLSWLSCDHPMGECFVGSAFASAFCK